MDDPKDAALRLLRDRDLSDPARALEGCTVTLRHANIEAGQDLSKPPRADVLIHAPGDLISEIRKGKPPTFDWGNQIERALRDAANGAYEIRLIQWVESGPNEAPRPGTMGTGPSGGNAAP